MNAPAPSRADRESALKGMGFSRRRKWRFIFRRASYDVARSLSNPSPSVT